MSATIVLCFDYAARVLKDLTQAAQFGSRLEHIKNRALWWRDQLAFRRAVGFSYWGLRPPRWLKGCVGCKHMAVALCAYPRNKCRALGGAKLWEKP
jgi:hypothetical protein